MKIALRVRLISFASHDKPAPRPNGFTLVEIIAVLVILGILAAVAIPKYQELQKQAEQKAALGVVSAGISHLNMIYYASLLRNSGDTGQAEQDAKDSTCTEVPVTGGFDLFCFSGTVIAQGPTGESSTQVWNAP